MDTVLMPMVGKIVKIDVKDGDSVEAGQQIGIFESMKMEMPLMATSSGVIGNIKAAVGQVVEADAPICDIA
ncbi:MAG: acetyl-CoA carboxylase biotin carboxyl carrier protein subunit [Pseudomonadota bacterium]